MTVEEACRLFLAQHEASPARMEVLGAMLDRACAALGDIELEQLDPAVIARWRAAMPAPTRWQATQALMQVTGWAQRWHLASADPLQHVSNPRPRVTEFRAFADWSVVEAVAAQLPPALRLLPIIGAGCGLRPGELLGLAWDCVDLDRRELQVRRSVWRGELRSTLKTGRSRRAVPIRARVAEHLRAARPAGADPGALVLQSQCGGPLDLHNVRRRAWRPALQRASVEHPHRIYDLRHTYATWSLRAGVSLFQLARRMGTSVDMIDATYGHLAADAADHERSLLDAWDHR